MHSQEFAAHLAASSRNFFLSGEMELLTGARLSFTGGQALSFMMSEGGNDGQLLGGAFSASCSLSLYDEEGYFTPYSLKGARVQVNLCAGEHQSPLAVFYVTKAVYRPESRQITLAGSDALGVAFETAFADDFPYPLTLGEMAARTAAMAGYQLPADFPNHEILIEERPRWGDISLRQALAYMAGAAGCFAAMDRQDHLMFRRAWQDGISSAIPAAQILSMEAGDAAFGPLTSLSIQMKGAPRDAQPLLVKTGNEQPGSFNCLSISDHPLFAWQASHTELLAQGVLSALQGMRLMPFRLFWRGDPERMMGDRVKVILPSGEEKEMLITRQSTIFSQGFSMQSDCAVRLSQSTAGRIFTSSGALNAARLSGNINGALIQDGSIAASSLVAGSITALQLSADAVTAEKLAAGSVEAKHIAAGAVNADSIAADAIDAKHLSVSALDAASAHILNAEIDWAEIKTLQAAIADITSAEIQNADIDFAKIKDVSADSAIITKGAAGELYISRLAVTEANLVSLSVGQLMVKGADGAFYALSVDENGAIRAEKKLVGNADIGNQTINAGEKLIEGSVTAETLNAREIFGDSALIRQLIAANLDVDTLFAREAMISKLNALDITGNDSIRIYVQRQDEMNAFLRVTENGLEIGKVGDPAIFRADNRTLEVTNVKTERLGITQRMTQNEEWAFAAYGSGLSIKWIGGDV